jgi:hypothetical protein
MQRFSEYKSALASEQFRTRLEALPISDLVHEGQATSSLWLQFVSDVATSPDNLDFTDPASILCFLFPSNFKQFNWMYIHMKDIAQQQDEEMFGSIEKVFFIRSSDNDAKTVFIRANHTRDLPASFCQLNFPTSKIDSTISAILSSTKKENKFVISSKLPQGFPNISRLIIPKTISFDSSIDPRAKFVLNHSQLVSDLKKWLHTRDYLAGLTTAHMEEEFKKAYPNYQASQVQPCIQLLINNGFLYQSYSVVGTEYFLVVPTERMWKDLRFHINTQTFHTQFKDLGIWLDKSGGHPDKPLPYKCFCLHVAHAYMALTKKVISAAQLNQYMQFRFTQFKLALDHLEQHPPLWAALSTHHQQCMETCNESITDPNFASNSAFWSQPDILAELAVSSGEAVNTSIWGFMLLPTEFHQYNYLIVNVRGFQDATDIKSLQINGPSHYFASPQENARTIIMAYQGGRDGHFFLLRLHKSAEEEFIKLANKAASSIHVQLQKQEKNFWSPIANACQDSSLQAFLANRPANFDFNFDKQAQSEQAPKQPPAPAALPPKQSEFIARLKGSMTEMSRDISNLCDQADEFVLIVPEEVPTTKLSKYIDELSDIISQVQTLIEKATVIDGQFPAEHRPEDSCLIQLQSCLPPILELKNKFVRAKEAKSKPKKVPKQHAAAKQPEATLEKTSVDFMFKVKSVFPSDDISDQISESNLMSLFIIVPIPHSTVTFYHSIVQASCNLSIVSEMEAIFQRKLTASKELACEIHKLTRDQFFKVQDCPMVKGGRTFNEYLAHKGAKSWCEIANDHILGEVSLCSQLWKLNIAVIWRHEDVWRLFVSVNGGSSPILPLLYAKTKYIVSSDGFPEFCAGTAGRFFPLLPINEEWYLNEVFISSIPESLSEEEHQEITLFNKRVDKEFLLASVIQCEGTASSDSSSVVTADHASELLMNSFIDYSAVSQGSLPTPPEIKAIPLKKQCEAVNTITSIPLRQISAMRRKRIVESSPSPSASQKPPDYPGTGGDSARGSA